MIVDLVVIHVTQLLHKFVHHVKNIISYQGLTVLNVHQVVSNVQALLIVLIVNMDMFLLVGNVNHVKILVFNAKH